MPQNLDILLPILEAQPVIPVIVIDNAAHAVPLARALAAGGLPAVEITLRTPAAHDAIRAVADAVPEAIVGAGTALNEKQFDQAVAAGSKFVVSPGFTRSLGLHAARGDVPLLPGVSSPSEIMDAAECGYSVLKFFPAQQSGGAPYLKSLASPFSGIRFCPTGSITAQTANDYLALPNVICVGGSWVAPKQAMDNGDWNQITELAQAAAKLG